MIGVGESGVIVAFRSDVVVDGWLCEGFSGKESSGRSELGVRSGLRCRR